MTCENLKQPIHANDHSLVENVWLASVVVDDGWDLCGLSSLVLVLADKLFLELSTLLSLFLLLSGKDLLDDLLQRPLLELQIIR